VANKCVVGIVYHDISNYFVLSAVQICSVAGGGDENAPRDRFELRDSSG
jgi:hypothetical protein